MFPHAVIFETETIRRQSKIMPPVLANSKPMTPVLATGKPINRVSYTCTASKWPFIRQVSKLTDPQDAKITHAQ